MVGLYAPAEMIDTHQHLWLRSQRPYDWITPEHGPLLDDFGPERVAHEIAAVGISGTVLVQAADTYADTFYMLSVAEAQPHIRGVVAWVPLDRPAEASAAIQTLEHSPLVKGVRNLTHNYPDPRWLLRDDVQQTISLLAPRRWTLDVVGVTQEQLRTSVEVADAHRDLTVVLDHLGSPPIASRGWEPWATLVAEFASRPNTAAKLSGLSTVSSPDWTFSDWAPYVQFVVEQFGSDRIMMGSDWPVATLGGDFVRIWRAQRDVIAHLNEEQQSDILFRTARRVYRL